MSSPFRSAHQGRRLSAAMQIAMDDTLVEIERLRKEIAKTTDKITKNRLRTHLRATQAHYQGWVDYIGQECPRVKNATEHPKQRSH